MLQLLKPIISSVTTICPGTQVHNTLTVAQGCSTGIPKASLGNSQVHTVLQLVFGIIAAIAVLVIVINGLRLVISQGSPETVKKAREAIIASVIGLVIAVSAEIIVSFVLGKL